MRIFDVPDLIDRLARPVYNWRRAHALENDVRVTPEHHRRGARTRANNALREVKTIVDDACGLAEVEERLWDRALVAEAHARRYGAADRTDPSNRAARLHREMRRIYQVKAEAFVEAVALLRVGSGSMPVIAHAQLDVDEEFNRKVKEHFGEEAPSEEPKTSVSTT